MKTKITKHQQSLFNYIRNNESSEFYCERCNKSKKSKIIVKWINTNGEEKTICNACYGNLLNTDL